MIAKELSNEPRLHPTFIEPMEVLPARELPDGGNWTYEAKLDGYRCVVARRKGGTTLWSRRGTSFTARFPKIVWTCEKLPPDTLIDGEVIVVGEDGRCSFNAPSAQQA